MRTAFLSILSFLLISSGVRTHQANNVISALHQYSYKFPQEKTYLHLDKPYYGLNETIWFKSYLVESVPLFRGTPSRVMKVELIDPQKRIIASRTLKVENFGAAGDFFLADTLNAGKYTMRAYTDWMRNFPQELFYQRSFEVYGESEEVPEASQQKKTHEVSISFTPEGGDLVSGINSLVGFKAINENGLGVNVEGEIVDNLGNTITSFESQHLGMGIFPITPEEGKSYHARFKVNDGWLEKPLPEIKPGGMSLKLLHRFGHDQITFIVSSSQTDLQDSFILLHQNGRVLSKIENFGDREFFSGNFSKKELPEGILKLTLFDRFQKPRAERVLMVNLPEPQEVLDVSMPESTPGLREKTEIRLDLKDLDGDGMTGNVSVSITPKNIIKYPINDQNIKNYLQISSELKGHVEQPEFYFSGDESSYKYLDILLLTQGWRKFIWDQVLNKEFEASFQPQTGLSLSGKMVSVVNEKKPASGVITALLVNDNFSYYESETTAEGEFRFDDLEFEGETEVVIKARRKTKKGNLRNDTVIKLEEKEAPNVSFLPPSYEHIETGEFQSEQRKINLISEAFNFDKDARVLDEVKITSLRKEDHFKFAPYSYPTYRMNVDDQEIMSGDIFHLLSRIPRVGTRNVIGGGTKVVIRNRAGFLNGTYSVPRIIFDGRVVDSDFISAISADQIQYIDVLVGMQAMLVYGAGNAVVIYPKKDFKFEGKRPEVITLTQTGYYQAKEFYSPDYGVPKAEHAKPDIRSTLFWRPDVFIDEQGNGSVSFYTSDQKGMFDVRIEGISETGNPLFAKGVLVVE